MSSRNIDQLVLQACWEEIVINGDNSEDVDFESAQIQTDNLRHVE